MLIHINRETLLRPLQAVAGVAERRHTLPILSNVLIEATPSRLTFIATDLEIQITVTLENPGLTEEFAITTSARKLLDICRSLSEGADLSLALDEGKIKIKAGSSHFQLQTLPAEDFPKFKSSSEEAARLQLEQHGFKKLIHRVQYAMAQQDIRYYLNGLLLLAEAHNMKAVTTDGHRLAMCGVELKGENSKQEVILPRKTVTELIKLLSEDEALIDIELRPTQAKFSFANIIFESKVIDGKFPDYQKVVPTGYTKQITLSRLALLQAMQRTAILANDKFRGVRLMLTPNNLSVACSNNENEEAQEDLAVSYQGESLDIGFNINYLMDVLNNLNSEEVSLAFGEATSSCLITAPNDAEFKYVVAPIRI